jgi:hypothetical protein
MWQRTYDRMRVEALKAEERAWGLFATETASLRTRYVGASGE